MQPKDDPGVPDLPALVASFIAHLSIERGLSPHTCDAYRRDCERFVRGLEPGLLRAPRRIGEKEVFDHLVSERKRGQEVTSARRSLSALRTFFGFLVRERVVDKNPARSLENPRTWERVPSFLRVDEMRRLLEAVRDHPSRHPLRDAALLELAYATGLRVGELVSLRMDGLRPDLGILRCLGKGSRERIVPVSRRSLEAVDEYLRTERPRLVRRTCSELIFVSRGGKPLGRETVNAFLKKYARLAGLPGRISPHVIRHSFATHMIQGGADLRIVQEILGHVKVETTEIYTHLNKTDLKAAHRKHHPRG